jgi:hypothetical protein
MVVPVFGSLEDIKRLESLAFEVTQILNYYALAKGAEIL